MSSSDQHEKAESIEIWDPNSASFVPDIGPYLEPVSSISEMFNYDLPDFIQLDSDLQADAQPRAIVATPNTSSVIHDVKDWPGDYGFTVSFEAQEKVPKNVSWTYSEMKRKLYTKMNSVCPLRISSSVSPPEGSKICIVGLFKDSDSALENVQRCPNHSRQEDPSNANHENPSHWIRCDDRRAQYHVDESNNKRHCLLLPFINPCTGSEHSVYRFLFMCRNSCAGGPNRRATNVVFLLQDSSGNDLGRQVIEVKVCACPGRDRKHDEEEATGQSSTEHEFQSDVERHATVRDDEEVFSVTVRGRKNYDILKQVAKALELKRDCERGRLVYQEACSSRKRMKIKKEVTYSDDSE